MLDFIGSARFQFVEYLLLSSFAEGSYAHSNDAHLPAEVVRVLEGVDASLSQDAVSRVAYALIVKRQEAAERATHAKVVLAQEGEATLSTG